jgi:hypothetical protein
MSNLIPVHRPRRWTRSLELGPSAWTLWMLILLAAATRAGNRWATVQLPGRRPCRSPLGLEALTGAPPVPRSAWPGDGPVRLALSA